ncbi:MAG: hypothetical protein JXC32_05330 [Anaerolineae bacterium]|nr:hypothetical protein [Anaerolineae bacterium]
MASRRTVVNRRIIHLPGLCAWCGQREGLELMDVRLVDRHLWMQLHHSLSLPICGPCKTHVMALREAERRFEFLLLLIVVPIAVAIMAVVVPATDPERDWLVFGLGAAVLAAVLLGGAQAWLAGTDLGARIIHRRIEGAPPGYVGRIDAPGEIADKGKLRFYSREFHQAFADLNPELASRS